MVDYKQVIRELNYLNDYVQVGFKVQRFIKYPCPWIAYNDPGFDDYVKTYGFPNHREILMHEILIDVDSDNIREGYNHAEKVEKRFKRFKYFYGRWRSGGDGEHFQMLFKRDEIFPLICKYGENMVRPELIKLLVGKRLLHPKGIKSHICLVNKKLVQIENMEHRKGGIKEHVNTVDGMNNIPKELKVILKEKKERMDWAAEKLKSFEGKKNLPTMNCIDFYLGKTVNGKSMNKIQDGYYRAMFALAAHYKRLGKTSEEIFYKLKTWKNSVPENCREHIDDTKILYSSKNTQARTGCLFNETTLETIGAKAVCNKCQYNKFFEDITK